MKNLFGRLAVVAALSVSMTQVATAGGFADMGAPACAPKCDYAEGTWAVAARAGIAPTVFSRDPNLTGTINSFGFAVPAGNGNVNIVATPATGVFRTNVKRSFNKYYKLPFTGGVDVGYFLFDNWEVFVNFDFTHASARTVSFTENYLNNPAQVDFEVGKLNGFAGYIGSRYYFCAWDCVIPFIGAKLGVKGHDKRKEKITIRDQNPDLVYHRTARKGTAGFSGGLQFGMDWKFHDNYAVTLMAEMIGTYHKHFKDDKQVHATAVAANANSFDFSSQVTRNTKGLLAFPVTLGVRATF